MPWISAGTRYNCISYRRSPLSKNPRTSDLSPYCTRGINFLQQCWPRAFKATQWAYLQSRSTGDALLAVCAHMHQVRSLLAAHSSTLPSRFQGVKQPKMLGGISISLDVKKAFDSLRHDFLTEAMQEAMFDECEIRAVLFLHSQACLQVGKSEHASRVYLGTGVRQGCSLSPLLWALATGKFFRLYQQALRQQQLPLGSTSLFADDVFGSWMYRTPSDFKLRISNYRLAVPNSPSKLCPHTNTLGPWYRIRASNCLTSSIAFELRGEVSGVYITS